MSFIFGLLGLNADLRRYALETMTSFALVFIAFGVGLDPRQREVFGPALSPILVGISRRLIVSLVLINLGWPCTCTVHLCI